jgi:hypothetical protein
MTDTATPETGPVDAPASAESIAAELMSGNTEAPANELESVTQELVNEAEGKGEADEAPATEDDATEPVEEAENPEESSPEQQQMVTVKVNGEDREVPLAEALAGYSRLEDYKAKTAEVAEQRRQIEAKASTIEADIKAHYASQLEEATNLFAQFDPVLAEARTINWEALKAADPAAFVAAQDAVNARLTAIQQMQQQVESNRTAAQQRQQQEAEQERAQRFDKAADAIVKEMPELADEAKFQAFATDAVSALRESGFNDAEIAESLDDRVLKLANEARQWRAHVAAQKSLPEKRVVPKSAVKPLTTDGSGSRANPPRFPGNASRDRKVDWVTSQLLEG